MIGVWERVYFAWIMVMIYPGWEVSGFISLHYLYKDLSHE